MVFSIMPMAVFSEDDITSYLTYEIIDGEVTITDCDESISGDVVIPDTIEGYPVTVIGSSAFDYCDNLTSVTIPDSVKIIEHYAFGACDSLESVIIGASVTTIANQAFDYCYSLESVTISASVESIDDDAFYNESLISITVDENNQYYSSDEYGVLYNKDKTVLIQYPGGNERTSYIIPDSVTTISRCAFEYGASLTSVTIPDSVEKIEWRAFQCCYSLESVTLPDSVTSIESGTFSDCTSLISITIPDSVTNIDSGAFYNTACYNNDANWQDGVLYIGNRIIDVKDDITECKIKDGTLTIPGDAFAWCTSLTSITIPDSVTSIGERAFAWCTSLTSITIPDSVASIGRNAFYKTAYYNDDTNWQDGILYLDNFIIGVKNNITECKIKDGISIIPEHAFAWCYSLESVTLPNSVTTIDNYAFSSCASLEKVECNGKIDKIGEGAFQNCISLEEITGFEYVEKIGSGAFFNCPSLNGKLVFENNAVEIDMFSIGYSLFDYIADVKTIAEHLAQYRHAMGEEYTCEDGECYSMYSMKEIEVPDNASDLTEEELVYEILKQGRNDEYTISGYRGSNAEKYANEYGFTFISLGCYIHEYGDEEVLVAPTYTTTGRKGQRCKYCTDEINVVEIPCLEIEDSEEMEDKDTGVSVIFPEGTFEEDADIEINVTPVEEGDAYKLISHKEGNYKVTMFDISITSNGEEIQPNGTILVKIPLPKGYNQNKCVVYYVADDGTLEELKTYHYKDGYVYFETNHFSYYAVVEETEVEEETDFFGSIKSFFDSIKAFFENLINILKNFLGIVE